MVDHVGDAEDVDLLHHADHPPGKDHPSTDGFISPYARRAGRSSVRPKAACTDYVPRPDRRGTCAGPPRAPEPPVRTWQSR
jgi:hypothetical protein